MAAARRAVARENRILAGLPHFRGFASGSVTQWAAAWESAFLVLGEPYDTDAARLDAVFSAIKDQAAIWFRTWLAKALDENDDTAYTWASLVEALRGEYEIPAAAASVWSQMMNLTQRDSATSTLTAYVNRFMELSLCVTNFASYPDDVKIAGFLNNMHPKHKAGLLQNLDKNANFEAFLTKAKSMGAMEHLAPRKPVFKRLGTVSVSDVKGNGATYSSNGNGGGRKRNGSRKKMASHSSSSSTSTARTVIQRPQSNASGGRKPGTCYHCGKPGHWRRDCPDRDQGNDPGAA